MLIRNFSTLARELFGEVLTPFGFSCTGSKYSMFHRKASDDIYHIVAPDMSKRGEWYDIRVFATSPKIEPLFSERFPDELGVPSDWFSYLNPTTGVGPDHESYPCTTGLEFRNGFTLMVKPALTLKAIPYLDRIGSIDELIPHIRRDGYMAFAMYHAGRREEAKPKLLQERKRLLELQTDDRLVVATISEIQRLLTTYPSE